MNDTNYQGQNTNDTQTQPMGTQTQDQQTPHPQQNMKIDDKAVAKMVGENKADIAVKLITEYGKNIPDIVDQVTNKVAETLMSMAGITANKVEVEITDTMTREEFDSSRNNNRRPLH